MAFAIKYGDNWREIVGQFTTGDGEEAVTYPSNWLDSASGTQRRALGAYVVQGAPDVPDGQVSTGLRIGERDGKPAYEHILVARPEPEPVVITEDRIITERARRLSRGFDFDFGDARGVHRIGTTESDMRGWDEVSKGANAAILVGAPESEIKVVTNTGPVALTAHEWQLVLLRGLAVRQPIFEASFALQAMNPIPADFANDRWWPA